MNKGCQDVNLNIGFILALPTVYFLLLPDIEKSGTMNRELAFQLFQRCMSMLSAQKCLSVGGTVVRRLSPSQYRKYNTYILPLCLRASRFPVMIKSLACQWYAGS